MRRRSNYAKAAGRSGFARDEAGSMTVFSMFVFLIILIVGGLAVDVMRYEHRRVHLQNTADRAVLAAGSLRQPNDPEEVVREYFRR
ncbi:MAG: Tad domain-containing protein [Rubellimicrobium sp.]|nr:Tad domain-containing protein [Rubellimicrobium sp.]